MEVGLPSAVSWLFAAWWLQVALRDLVSEASPRYRNATAIFLALVIAGQAVWIGVLMASGARALAPISLLGMAIAWVLWMVSALRGRT